ncbi:MAG TPA: PTS sugar transporter subunit IIA [Nevskiaceae bacterium]
MAKLDDILDLDRIRTGVSAVGKKRVLEEISQLLAKGTGDSSADDILASLAGREKLGSTGLGHGVAIPHGRIAGVSHAVGAFMRLRHPVEYAAHDGNPVDLVFGLLVPRQSTDEHLQILSRLAENFADEAFCRQVREAPDAPALLTLLTA